MHRQLARTAAERRPRLAPRNAPLVWLRTNALRKQPDASRACRPKRSQNFRRRGSSACAPPGCPNRRGAPWSGCAGAPYASSPPPRGRAEALAECPPARIGRGRGDASLAAVARPWSIQPSPKRRRHGSHRRPNRRATRPSFGCAGTPYASSTPLRGRAGRSARGVSASVGRARARRGAAAIARLGRSSHRRRRLPTRGGTGGLREPPRNAPSFIAI